MVTVCIFELRSAMRSVQKAFKIASLGTKHTIPDMSKEIDMLAQALKDNDVQAYIVDRPSNEGLDSVADLLEEGSKYPNSRTAFHSFRPDCRTLVNLGFQEPTVGDSQSKDDEEEAESHQEEYQATRDDLALDEEESYGGIEEALENLVYFTDRNTDE